VGTKGSRIEDPADWTDAKIVEKAKLITSDKGPAGNFED
jgi:fructose-bisphosphate aldolase class II